VSRGQQQQSGELAPGARLGAIEIVSLVGRGGMGAVYKGFERALDRTVAVKTLGDDVAGNPDYLERFHREARAACRVQNHPHVVSIHALGTHEGRPYIVMEFVEGESLATLVAGGPLPVERTAELMQGICAGVFAIHAAGIIHRDLKPQNIVIARGFRTGAQDPGLRHRQGRGHELAHRSGRRGGHAALPFARADPGRAAGRAQRHLLAGRDPVRMPHRPSPAR